MPSAKRTLHQSTVLVVTVCKDDPQGLNLTTESLIGQNFEFWRQTIVLTNRQDKSLKAALKLEEMDPRIRISFQDKTGIYNAMNTGLYGDDSEFVWFMNAGDIFENSQTISTAVELSNRLAADLVIGGYGICSQNVTHSRNLKEYTPFRFSLNRRGGCHQAMLFRRNKQSKIFFDENYLIAADFKLVLEITALGRVFQVPEILARITPGGISDTQLRTTLREKQRIRREFFGVPSLGFITGFLWTIAVKAKVSLRKIINFH